MIINAVFRNVEQVSGAIALLRQYGTNANQMEIFSSKPVELKPGVLDRTSKMSLIAVLAAIFVGSLVTTFIYYTQRDYPLVTGGMPLTSGWATGVVTFELTMAGAILGTVFMFIWESGLMKKSRCPAPDLPESGMILQIECDADVDTVVNMLQGCGAMDVDTLEKS